MGDDVLQFRPQWWWDPVPEWIIGELEKEVLQELAQLAIDFRASQLEHELKMTRQVGEILQKQRGA